MVISIRHKKEAVCRTAKDFIAFLSALPPETPLEVGMGYPVKAILGVNEDTGAPVVMIEEDCDEGWIENDFDSDDDE